MRIIRSWNQTGQKHAGESDIVKSVFPAHIRLLWCLVFVTYLDVARRLSQSGVLQVFNRISSVLSLILCGMALQFKLSFTKLDAPELLDGLPQIFWRWGEDVSLVVQSRAVFLSIGTTMLLVILSKAYQRTTSSGSARGEVRIRSCTQPL